MYAPQHHTFAVCAYKESPYLIDCIESLVSQRVETNVQITTSTPNAHIEDIAKQFGIPLYVDTASSGIASDWNFAYSRADTPLVTIAHQDDIYCEEYAGHVLEGMNGAEDPLIFFSDYGELRGADYVDNNQLLRIKRVLLKPLERKAFHNSIFIRRRILSLGSAICCPSVTMVKPALPDPLFRDGLETNLDWDAWERVSRLPGAFVYDPSILMYHRIHEESATTALINDQGRNEEDLILLRRFWPTPIARLINLAYAQSQKSNSL